MCARDSHFVGRNDFGLRAGPLATWYGEEGGRLALWQAWADAVQGQPLEAGHFFPEEAPHRTSDALLRFFEVMP